MSEFKEFAGRFSGWRRSAAPTGLGAWLADEFAADQHAWALWIPVAGGFGIAFYFGCPVEPPLFLGPAIIAAAAIAAIAARRQRGWLLLLLFLVAVGIGFSAAAWRAERVGTPLIEARTFVRDLEGRVESVEIRNNGSLRLVLSSLSGEGLHPLHTPRRIRLTVRTKGDRPWSGDRARVSAILLPLPEPSAPGQFDFARQAWFEGIGATGIAISPVEVLNNADAHDSRSVRQSFGRLRQAISQHIRDMQPNDAGAIASALMTGDRGPVPEDVIGAFRDSGLAHLLAISGLHIGLVAGIAFFAVRAGLALIEPLALRYPIKKWAACAAIAVALAYMLASGATIPTQRAFIMTSVVFLAVILDRSAISMRLVAWAAAAILLLAPESLLSVSFQMSFAAVIALIAAYEAAKARLAALRREMTTYLRKSLFYVAGGVFTTIVAEAAIAPFAIYHFNQTVAYGVLANAVAVPLMALWIMPFALLSFIAMPFGAEYLPLAAMCAGIDVVIGVGRWVSQLPGSVIWVPAWPLSSLVLVAMGSLWLCLWRRRWRLLGLAPVFIGLIVAAFEKGPDILVNGDGKLIAVRTDSGALSFSSGRRESFAREAWMRHNAQLSYDVWPITPAAKDRGPANRALTCDATACLYRKGAHLVAFSFDPRSYEDDCAAATLLISQNPVRRRCESATNVIDRFDVWRNGGHAIWLDDGRIRVETVRAERGERPWTIAR